MEIINIEDVKKEFIKFTENYDLNNERIKGKQEHSLRVMEISNKIATEEGFSNLEIEIATLIGLLHDIARFKQYTEYQTFKDDISIDHGEVAVQILEKDNYIRKYIETDKYDEIIKIAIKNHNKLVLEDGLTEEQEKFSKLIRDADKIDIIYQKIKKYNGEEKQQIEESKLNPEVKKDFDKMQTIDNRKYPNIGYADNVVQIFGFMFDINYQTSYKIINQEGYIEKLVNGLKIKDEYTQKEIINAKNQAKQYIINKIEKKEV